MFKIYRAPPSTNLLKRYSPKALLNIQAPDHLTMPGLVDQVLVKDDWR
jgi:hypothetical protein